MAVVDSEQGAALNRDGTLKGASTAETSISGAIAANKRWLLATLAIVVIWTAELFWVQAATLIPANSGGPRFDTFAPLLRLFLDFAFISTLCLVFRGKWLVPFLLVAFAAHLGLYTYFGHFGRPLSVLTIYNQFNEGVAVADAVLEEIPRGAAMLLAAALAAKLGLLYVAGRPTLPARLWGGAAGAMLVCYAGLMFAATFIDPLHYITTTRGIARLGLIRGYLGPWVAEWYYLTDSALLDRAIERRNIPHDALTKLEGDIPIHQQLVIIQAESLDTNSLDLVADGKEVTPFLNELRKRSMFYRVGANHDFGSSDADFALLNGCLGSPDCNTWVIAAYPYANTTPQLLAECGYKTTVFHGNTGRFYGRRRPYETMGFERILFKEELLKDHALPTNPLGVKDQAVFELSSKMLAENKQPECHFVITLTTHTPYRALEGDEQELYPNPQTTRERYLNNMRYLDNCLKRYIESLGEKTTVMLYADHPTEGQMDEYKPDRDKETGKEFVPAMIFDTDQDLSKLQRTRNEPVATDGSLHLLDVVTYLRGQIKRNANAGGDAGVKADADSTAAGAEVPVISP